MDKGIDPPRDLLVFQTSREITNLSKHFLVMLEDLRDHEDAIDESQYSRLRKKTLDLSNNAIRNFAGFIDNFSINLRNESE